MSGFVIKVFALSAILSIAIKYSGVILTIPATPTNALIAVWFPALLMATLLGWRWQKSDK